MTFKISRIQRLSAVIGISMSFFIAEIAVGFYTGSLALVADAFHYLSDIIGFAIALVAAIVDAKHKPPASLTFGWQRAQLLGAFFNGVLLFGLGISIFLQSLERFISLEQHDHDHDHDHGHGDEHDHEHNHSDTDSHRHQTISDLVPEKHITHKHHTNAVNAQPQKRNFDLALMGVFIHVMGDCANNVGVIISGLVIWLANYDGRYYADPAVSMAIAILIFVSSLPLVKRSGMILLQSAPDGVVHEDVKHDLEQIPGIRAVHELHIWRLNQKKSLASAHLVLEDAEDFDFERLARTVNECFHAYGIHSVTLQPETLPGKQAAAESLLGGPNMRVVTGRAEDGDDRASYMSTGNQCQLVCGKLCDNLSCC
ncbi:cation efflux protein [Aspergillus bertholletiae]|uniref:Cation efflux protein n=1 Tax=Aspergillus bertholletiae TaxID=1226010 RepID=A0A5N7ASS2_9EURO|nr:cation efflux protein [Aspergillus bertholletiae]